MFFFNLSGRILTQTVQQNTRTSDDTLFSIMDFVPPLFHWNHIRIRAHGAPSAMVHAGLDPATHRSQQTELMPPLRMGSLHSQYWQEERNKTCFKCIYWHFNVAVRQCVWSYPLRWTARTDCNSVYQAFFPQTTQSTEWPCQTLMPPRGNAAVEFQENTFNQHFKIL